MIVLLSSGIDKRFFSVYASGIFNPIFWVIIEMLHHGKNGPKTQELQPGIEPGQKQFSCNVFYVI